MIIQRIDQMHKASRRFIQPLVELWHTLQQQGVKLTRQFQVVTCRARAQSEFVKIKPDYILGQHLRL